MQTAFKDFTDDVNGQIIGTYYQQAFLTYEGRKQGPTMYVESDDEANQAGQAYIEEQKKAFGSVFDIIYPNKSWAIKFV